MAGAAASSGGGGIEFSHRRALQAGMASFVGTSIEFYDFYVYATAAALVFGDAFFPDASPIAGLLFSFATYGVGFFFRPLGGVIFGHVGDRYGRRTSLVITLVGMGVATTLVGVLPTYSSVGVIAPILLVLLRVVQGISVGGEWGGAVLMAVENAPERFKGFYGAFPQLGNPAGALLATGAFALLTIGGNEFLESGGWRIPFLFSAVLIAVGFWVRYKVEETPVFQAQMAREEAAASEEVEQSSSTWEVITDNWKAIMLGIGLIPVSTGGYYIVTTFATAYATEDTFGIGMKESSILAVLTVAAFIELLSTLPIGTLADRAGRKRTMSTSLIVAAVLVVPMFLLIGQGHLAAMYVLFAVVRVALNGTWAPLASILSQMFRAEGRQTSVSVAYSFGVAIWGGLSPIIATGLYALTDSVWGPIGFFIALTVLSLVCLALAPQYRDRAVFIEDQATETEPPEGGPGDPGSPVASVA